jgi:hypothetical protein
MGSRLRAEAASVPPGERKTGDCKSDAGDGRERRSIALVNGVNADKVFRLKGSMSVATRGHAARSGPRLWCR